MRQTGRDSPVWAITSYYAFDDPPGVKRRLEAYREFRRRLQVPLVAVELATDGPFDLQPEDADVLVQLRGGSTLWQKERLLNVAVESLPRTCETVAWIDCDIVLLREDWPAAVRQALAESKMVQLFRRIYFLSKNQRSENPDGAAYVRDSVAYRWANGSLPEESFREAGSSIDIGYSPGGAWAARRELLERHGFYDALIVGGGDKMMWAAACGRAQNQSSSYEMGAAQKRHYLEWAESFWGSVQGRVGHIEGDACHLWHGDPRFRRYGGRHQIFGRLEFDPSADICTSAEGVWTWGSNKPDLHDWVTEIFEDRRR